MKSPSEAPTTVRAAGGKQWRWTAVRVPATSGLGLGAAGTWDSGQEGRRAESELRAIRRSACGLAAREKLEKGWVGGLLLGQS
nr:unnamed protein product [Digitaria exilis]